jgi:hypothetical protein
MPAWFFPFPNPYRSPEGCVTIAMLACVSPMCASLLLVEGRVCVCVFVLYVHKKTA